jgi:hypothetical protein
MPRRKKRLFVRVHMVGVTQKVGVQAEKGIPPSKSGIPAAQDDTIQAKHGMSETDSETFEAENGISLA